MYEKFNEVIADDELYRCPINEELRVLTTPIAFEILRMEVCAMDKSFLTGMHKEMAHHMLQRHTPATQVLFSPNICAELFTWQQYHQHEKYIVIRLIGAIDCYGYKIDHDTVKRQAYRKLLKLVGSDKEKCLVFFWNREPNLLIQDTDGSWIFHPDTPAYKSLVDFYGKHALVDKKGGY